jgi:hypothetical protein
MSKPKKEAVNSEDVMRLVEAMDGVTIPEICEGFRVFDLAGQESITRTVCDLAKKRRISTWRRDLTTRVEFVYKAKKAV